MCQVREVLRLKHVAGHGERRIAAAIGISRHTVAECLRRATVVGITWPCRSSWTTVLSRRGCLAYRSPST
jgi:hypothetical protein